MRKFNSSLWIVLIITKFLVRRDIFLQHHIDTITFAVHITPIEANSNSNSNSNLIRICLTLGEVWWILCNLNVARMLKFNNMNKWCVWCVSRVVTCTLLLLSLLQMRIGWCSESKNKRVQWECFHPKHMTLREQYWLFALYICSQYQGGKITYYLVIICQQFGYHSLVTKEHYFYSLLFLRFANPVYSVYCVYMYTSI